MIVSPIDYRYGREELKKIFDAEEKLNYMLKVEGALALSLGDLGIIPKNAAVEINTKASTKYVKLSRVNEIEKVTKHDITALVRALSEQCGDYGQYVHYGATSNDIIDSAQALQIKDSLPYLENGLEELKNILVSMAKKYMHLPMLGRTHGQAAVPITAGLKFAVFSAEIVRHMQRLNEIKPRIIVGKMSGAVGSGAVWQGYSIELEKKVMEYLGISPELGPTQLVGRDRYAEFIALLALISTTLEKFAVEVRLLQQTEINEFQEPFSEHQIGSSTMAQKRNPIVSENICSLARFIRGFLVPSFENIPLWHERDLSNSANERFTLPYSIILLDHLITQSIYLFKGLNINESALNSNLERFVESTLAENAMIFLTDAGMKRAEAHEFVRNAYFEAQKKGMKFSEYLVSIGKITENQKSQIFNIDKYVKSSVERTEYIIKVLEGKNNG